MWKRCLAGSLVAASVAGAATESATLETGANSAFAYVQKDWPARGLTAGELEEALEEWDGDRAVLLYASWCRYCRQFKPIWHAVNKFFQANGAKNIEVLYLSCGVMNAQLLNLSFLLGNQVLEYVQLRGFI